MVEDYLEEHQENAAEKYRRNQLQVLFSLTTCHLEHICQELSHLYVADPIRFSELPFNAAQHMLDGFPMELMDGDAGLINYAWDLSVVPLADHHSSLCLAFWECKTVARAPS
jgi:hypothetical protein